MVIAVDFDNTLAMGNTGHIPTLRPNDLLILRLRNLYSDIRPHIKIVTARGAKDGLPPEQRRCVYLPQIEAWLAEHGVPYGEVSFEKAYANLYIDDQTIRPNEAFLGLESQFTGSKVVLTDDTAIKCSKTAPLEFEWYKVARIFGVPAPEVLFCNSDCIITRRVHGAPLVASDWFIDLLHCFQALPSQNSAPFDTYLDNLVLPEAASKNTYNAFLHLYKMSPKPTFFHGDLSTTNVLVSASGPVLIDPNSKHIFGSYLTDAGKAAFSLIAYEGKFQEAEKIAAEFGPEVWCFAVAEGLRVCKYQAGYISHVNNIADYIFQSVTLSDAATG